MAMTIRTAATGGVGTDASRRTATIAGGLYPLTFGPDVMAAVNALLPGAGMYRSGPVPRAIPHVLAAATTAFWELSLGVHLVVQGSRPSPHTAARRVPAQREFDGGVR
jgi:hypothetical protein